MAPSIITRVVSTYRRVLAFPHFRELAGIFFIGYAVTLLVMPGLSLPVSDTPARLGVAHWLWTGEAVQGEWIHYNGGNYPWYGMGQSLVLLPFDLVATAFTQLAGVSGEGEPALRFLLVSYMAFPLVNGLCAATSYVLLLQLGFDRRTSIVGTFCLLSCTTLLWHFQNNQENPLHLLLIMAASSVALSCVRGNQRLRLTLAFVIAGFATLMRLTAVVDYAAVFAIAVGASAGPSIPGQFFRQNLRAAVNVSVIAIPVGVFYLFIDRAYHYARFGEVGSTYTHLIGAEMRAAAPSLPASFPFCVPFLDGAAGFLFSPAKSIFLYDPLLLVTLIVVVAGWKELNTMVRTSLLAVTLALAGTIAAYSTFYCWTGESSWGARYVSVPVHLLCLIGAAIVYSRFHRRRERGRQLVAVPILVLTVCLQLSALVYPSYIELTQAGLHELSTTPTPEMIARQGYYPHFVMRFENILTAAGPADDFRASSARRVLWLLPLSPLEPMSPAWRVALRTAWALLLSGVILVATRLAVATAKERNRP